MPLIFALHPVTARLLTTLIAMTPIFELRGAIPIAIASYGLGWREAYLYAVIGNFLPVIPILLLLEPVSDRLRQWPAWDRFFTWLFARARRRGRLIERFEILGLVLFVGIPLPVTGAWTGCAAAYLFRLPLRKSVPAVFTGILLAGVVVTLASLGVISFWGLTSVR